MPRCGLSPRAAASARASLRSPKRPTSASGPSTTTSTARSSCSGRRPESCWNSGAGDRPGLCGHQRPCGGVRRIAADLRAAGLDAPRYRPVLDRLGLESVDASRGLAPRALRDIRAGQAAGCFTVADAQIALSAVAGGLLGLLRSRERHPERVDEASVDQLTEACLRLLGVSASEAARLVASRLPLVGTVSR